ncbi:MAG TPA: Pycsar system effector family protein, partial [Flavobacterium sp.]|nr:Pycsar system effector family protein [Flavobacterium sp.]
IMDFTGDGGRERMKNLYEQIILRDFSLSKESWYDILLPLLEHSAIHTEFGKAEIEPGLAKLAKSLRKERKDIEEKKSRAIERELAISEEEIKQLKKEISKAQGRDDRGIQTLFRNISRNHYTLNQMVDGKANIMITVNSIILSLILGGSMGTIQEDNLVRYIPFFLLGGVNIVSIIFAVLAITPVKTQGNFTEDEVRNKQGNLLYFGNFHNMTYRDFEWGFLQMLNDKDYLYGSMIRDYYYQAQGLERKYRLLRGSLYVFFIGLSLAMVLQGILKLIELTA